MPAASKPSFAFLVLAYNHQDYILEHMESIKYLVQTYGAGSEVDLIVNDDCSRDQTRTLVNRWLTGNRELFRHVKTIYNAENLGTCASVNNMLACVVADRCKLTAGDDVYSFENIFELAKCGPNEAMLSGRPLYLLDGELRYDFIADTLVTATQIIYRHDTLLHRFKHFSYNNAPNLLYSTECLQHHKVRTYLQRFDVMEDWPLQVAIAQVFPERQLKLIDEVFVYYRRTAGSTYIVANQRFRKDKLLLYDDLISNESSSLEILRLKNRKFCFKLNNLILNKIVNLDFYLFIFSFFVNVSRVFSKKNSIKTRSERHQIHYETIKNNARNAS